MDDLKKDGLNDTTEASAASRVLRELLRTPAVKDLLALSVSDPDPQAARDLAREMLWEDAVFSFGVLGQLPRGLNFLVAFLDELGRQLGQVPPHLLREFALEMARNADLESLKALPRAYAPLLHALVEESVIDPRTVGVLATSLFETAGGAAGDDPQAARERRERKSRFYSEAIKGADFGKIRSAVTRRAEESYPVMESMITAVVGDPVIFANLINILPPLVNNLLKGTARALAEIDFPPEILASAVFNLLDDLEAAELGEIANNLGRFINCLHEGSAVLGRTEPRFRPVLQRFLEKTLQGVDEKEAAGALLALAEDAEVILYVLADTAAEKPELLEEAFSTLLHGFNANLRGLTYLLEQMNRFSPDLYRRLAGQLENTDFNEAGKLLNNLVKLVNRICAENPDLVEEALASLYRSLDKEELSNLGSLALQQGVSFAAKENLLELFPPEKTGKALSACLAAYNRGLSREPDRFRKSLSLYLAHLDPEELSTALLLTSDQFSQTLSENPQLSKSVVKSFWKILRGAIKGSLRRKPGSRVSHGPESRALQGRGK